MIDWIQSVEGQYGNVLAITHRLGSGEPLYDFEGGIKTGSYATLSRFELQWPRVRTIAFDLEL